MPLHPDEYPLRLAVRRYPDGERMLPSDHARATGARTFAALWESLARERPWLDPAVSAISPRGSTPVMDRVAVIDTPNTVVLVSVDEDGVTVDGSGPNASLNLRFSHHVGWSYVLRQILDELAPASTGELTVVVSVTRGVEVLASQVDHLKRALVEYAGTVADQAQRIAELEALVATLQAQVAQDSVLPKRRMSQTLRNFLFGAAAFAELWSGGIGGDTFLEAVRDPESEAARSVDVHIHGDVHIGGQRQPDPILAEFLEMCLAATDITRDLRRPGG